MNEKTLWFRVPDALHRQLKSLAALRGATIAEEGRRAVETHVANDGIALCTRGTLLCPACSKTTDDEPFVHIDRVTVHVREEDAEPGATVVEIPDKPAARSAARQEIPNNPSARRSGLVVEGWCELCGSRWELTLAQHKGQTLISVEVQEKTDQAAVHG